MRHSTVELRSEYACTFLLEDQPSAAHLQMYQLYYCRVLC
jgi:hypothetical protein